MALKRAALELLKPSRLLVSCSCSFHLETAELQKALQLAVLRAVRADRRAVVA